MKAEAWSFGASSFANENDENEGAEKQVPVNVL